MVSEPIDSARSSPSRQPNGALLERRAYHEAGHAVAAYLVRRTLVKRLSLSRRDPWPELVGTALARRFAGLTEVRWPDQDCRETLEGELIVALAGRVAEGIRTGRQDWGKTSTRIPCAEEGMARVIGDDEECRLYLRWVLTRTKALLSAPEHWAAVRQLAGALAEHGDLGCHKVLEIIEKALDEHRCPEERGGAT